MENTIGGCYHCNDCGVGVDDLVFRLPIKNKENNKTAESISELTKLQNQKAIECLKKVLEHFTNRPTYFDVARLEYHISDQDKKFIDYIDNKIKELEGE